MEVPDADDSVLVARSEDMAFGEAESRHYEGCTDLHIAEDAHSMLLLSCCVCSQGINDEFTIGGARSEQGIIAVEGNCAH